jgi:hypothetical protein
MRARPLVVATLALSAGAASGEQLQLLTPPPPPAEAAPRVDAYGHLLATPDRELFQVGRVRLELRAAAGSASTAEPFGPPDPAPHEVQRYFQVDSRATSLVFRFVPTPAAPAPR